MSDISVYKFHDDGTVTCSLCESCGITAHGWAEQHTCRLSLMTRVEELSAIIENLRDERNQDRVVAALVDLRLRDAVVELLDAIGITLSICTWCGHESPMLDREAREKHTLECNSSPAVARIRELEALIAPSDMFDKEFGAAVITAVQDGRRMASMASQSDSIDSCALEISRAVAKFGLVWNAKKRIDAVPEISPVSVAVFHEYRGERDPSKHPTNSMGSCVFCGYMGPGPGHRCAAYDLKDVTTLREVVVYFKKHGTPTGQPIAEWCMAHRSHVPILMHVTPDNMRERIAQITQIVEGT